MCHSDDYLYEDGKPLGTSAWAPEVPKRNNGLIALSSTLRLISYRTRGTRVILRGQSGGRQGPSHGGKDFIILPWKTLEGFLLWYWMGGNLIPRGVTKFIPLLGGGRADWREESGKWEDH